MRRTGMILISLALILSLTSCGSSGGTTSKNTDTGITIEQVLEEGVAAEDARNATEETGTTDAAELLVYDVMEQADLAQNGADSRQSGVDAGAPQPEDTADAQEAMSSTEGVDVDLTRLSATMVYAEVYNMLTQPSEYMGKTIRMNGMEAIFYDEGMDKYYFACIILDATQCCSQGIEFELTDDYTYPDDYPEDGTMITVTGVFDTYEEAGATYAVLRDAELTAVY